MNNQQINIPKLRFPEFKGEWEKKKLGEIAERVSTKNIKGIDNVLTISAQYGLISQLEFFNKSVSAKDVSGYYLLTKNDFAYNKSYSNGYPMGAIKRLTRYESGVVSTLYICFRNKNEFNNSFAEQYFETGAQNKEIEKVAQEGARNHGLLNIGVGDFFNIELTIPSLPGQSRIASFFSAIDEKLKLETQRLTALKQYKKGVMQKLFSQELRFKDENGKEFPDWEIHNLTNLVRIEKGVQFNKEDLYSVGEYPCINGGVEPSGFSDKKNRKKNTITLSEGGNSCGYVNFIKTSFWCGGHCYTIEPNDNIDNLYLYQILKYYESEIMSLRVGSGLPNIQKKDILSFKLNISISKNEQTKIANFLSSIDDKINQTENKLNKIQTYKKGLLQQMFV